MTILENVRAVALEIPWPNVALVATTAIVGLLLARLVSGIIGRQVDRRMDETSGMIARKLVFYGLILFGFAVVLRELDVSLGALLAAGGLFGVALGFASQTAVSNIISGIFLIFERPFNVGDVIKINEKFGVVESIDLLSTKVRMFDNLFWRMPNEQLLKSDIITVTKYDIRRLDIATSISYDDNIQEARDTLIETAERNHLVLGDPEPVVLVNRMGESGIDLTLRCWFYKTDYIQVLTEMTHQVKESLEAAGCTIPFPHRTVYVRNEEDWEKAESLRDSNPT
jgi:small-conductance mechanosensitive channel